MHEQLVAGVCILLPHLPPSPQRQSIIHCINLIKKLQMIAFESVQSVPIYHETESSYYLCWLSYRELCCNLSFVKHTSSRALKPVYVIPMWADVVVVSLHISPIPQQPHYSGEVALERLAFTVCNQFELNREFREARVSIRRDCAWWHAESHPLGPQPFFHKFKLCWWTF